MPTLTHQTKAERIAEIEAMMKALLEKSRGAQLQWDDPEAARIRTALRRLQAEWKALR